MKAAVQFETDLLKNIGSVLRQRTVRTRYRVDQTLVAANKLLPSILFLTQTRLNQIVVRGIHFETPNLQSILDRREIGIHSQFQMYLLEAL
jgi:hypothetical protein